MSRSRLARSCLLAVALCGLGGCASPPARPAKALAAPAQSLRLGMQAWHDGELIRARQLFADALVRYRSIDHADGQWAALVNLGSVALVLGDTELARAQIAAASQLTEVTHPEPARLQLLAAQTDLQAGALEPARTALDALLQSTDAPPAFLLTVILERGRLAGALQEPIQPWIERAEALSHADTDPRLGARLARLRAAEAARRGDWPLQLTHLREALTIYRDALDRPGIAASHEALARGFADQHDRASALGHWQRALDVWLYLQAPAPARRCLDALIPLAEQLGQQEQAREYRRWREQLQPGSPIRLLSNSPVVLQS